MNRLLFFLVSLLGAAIVVWVAARFVGVNGLALAVTVLIGAAYGAGVIELWRFRRATASLAAALRVSREPAPEPASWLARVEDELRESVYGRIEGRSASLPGPVFTPYLVGLLVMLGLLGTFFGMVDTLSGAVGALQGSTELEAIRAGLAAPIAGLGVAFGTSVAGIAASACLGLLSVFSRRERQLEERSLDAFAREVFPEQHPEWRRQQTVEALQAQSAAVPAVVERLDALVDRLARLGSEIGDSVSGNQQSLHGALREDFSKLAEDVGSSLQSSLAESGRMAGEGIRPSLDAAVAALAAHSESTREQLASLTREQAAALSEQFGAATAAVHAEVAAAGERQGEANANLARTIADSVQEVAREQQLHQQQQGEQLLEQFQSLFERTGELVAEREAGEAKWLARHEKHMQNLTAQTAQAFEQLARGAEQSSGAALERLQGLEATLQQHRDASTEAESERLARQEQDMRELITRSAAELETLRTAESERAGDVLEQLQAVHAALAAQRDHIEQAESRRLEQQDAQLQALLEATASQLATLRDAEAERADAALARLEALEGVAAEHLTQLGMSLEAPMTRLIETASETPKAAAEVIAKLREELTNNAARDNQLLEERELLLERLQGLLNSLENSAAGQFDVVQSAVSRSAETLAELGDSIGAQVNDGVERLSGLAVDVAGSAGEVASLGEAFRAAVGQFSDANQSLIDGLERMEQAMERSGARSDEQLGYYVAQAREIIDHSVLSQKEIIEELRQLGGQQQLFEPEATE